jgi:hypothetical protein
MAEASSIPRMLVMRFPGSLISSRLRPGERKWHARPYQADAVNEKKTLNAAGGSLIVTNENVEVGKFSLMHVLGWWIQEE